MNDSSVDTNSAVGRPPQAGPPLALLATISLALLLAGLVVGVGRDYSDVTPLKGIYSGEGSTDLDVVVEITRLA